MADPNSEEKFGRPPPLARDVALVAAGQFAIAVVVLAAVAPPFVKGKEERLSYGLVGFVSLTAASVCALAYATNASPGEVFRGAAQLAAHVRGGAAAVAGQG